MKIILSNKTLSTFMICTVVLLANVNIQAEIYKWTDAKGVTHYSSQKPIQKKIKAEDIEDKIRSAAGKYRASQRAVHQTSVQAKNNPNPDTKQPKLAGPSEKLAKFCKNQRTNLTKLTKNYRNDWKEKNGKVTRLSQKQRQEKIKQIQKSIINECVGV